VRRVGTLPRSETQTSEAIVDLSIVIPAYNESSRIERTLERLLAFLGARAHSWEVVVADDGSRDRTADLVEAFAAARDERRIRVVRLGVNQGKGAALRAGVLASRGARVLVMDADLATPLEELSALEHALDAGHQIATGSRAVAASRIQRAQSPLRILLGRAGNLWIRLLAVPGIHDTQCGFKLFDGNIARELFARSRENRFGIDIEILCIATRKMKLDVAEVGVAWEHQSGSKVTWRDYVDVLFKVPRIALWVQRQRP